MPPPRLMLALVAFTARTGLLCLAPFICHKAAAVNHLTAAETAVYCSMMYRRTLTADMLAEVEATQANARQIAAEGIPDVPFDVGHYVHNEAADVIADESREFLQQRVR